MNNPSRCFFLFLVIGLFSCTKTTQAPSSPSSPYYGKWQFIRWSRGPSNNFPSPDSIVVLNLKPDNSYIVTFDGRFFLEGSFKIDSNANGTGLEFLNINKPYGDTTSVVSNGVTFLYFNTTNIGQLTLFQNNAASLFNDTLDLVSSPITPFATVNEFKRIQ